jgi:hypothetical protein
LRGHRHHVGVEIGDDPDGAGDDEKNDQHTEGESQNIVRAVGPGPDNINDLEDNRRRS